jgi:hypothetical protein
MTFELSAQRSKGRLSFIYDEFFLLWACKMFIHICMYNYGLVIAIMCHKFLLRKGVCLPRVWDFC